MSDSGISVAPSIVNLSTGYYDVGFDMRNTRRNATLAKLNKKGRPPLSTGTIIAGCIFEDGVVMACDTRATAGSFVAEKDCVKIDKVTDSIYACGAGTAADIHKMKSYLAAQLELHEMNTGRKTPVVAAVHIAKQYLFQYMGYVSSYLIIGGVDYNGPYLASVGAEGSTARAQFIADGSGCLAAYGVFEKGYKPKMSEKEAVALTFEAVQAGMLVDMACGNGMRHVIIRKSGTSVGEKIVPDFCKPVPRIMSYKYPANTTAVLKRVFKPYDVVSVEQAEQMDTSST